MTRTCCWTLSALFTATLIAAGGWLSGPAASAGEITSAAASFGSESLLAPDGTECRSAPYEPLFAPNFQIRGQGGGPKPWTIPQPPPLQKLGIRMGGWLQQGITVNGYDRTDGHNATVGTNDFDGEYQMNQFWVYFTKPINTAQHGWDIGGHVDMMYGTDWRFGINQGLEDRINGFDRQSYGVVIPQAYAEVGVGKFSVKAGHFAGILDYEAVPAVVNPFYSHSLCYGFTVPQLVTGVLGKYQITPQLAVQSGFHRGWMKFEDNNNHMDMMAGVEWKSVDGKTALNWAFSVGPQDDAGEQDRFVYSLVFKRQLADRLQWILVHNLGWENNGDFRSDQDAEWYGINQYLLYKITPKLSAGARIEWLRDDDGARIFGPPPFVGIRAWDGGPGFAGDFHELTLGLNYRPCPNVLLRPEVRWDWYEGTRGRAGEFPFNNGNRKNQFTTGMDMVVTF